MASFDTATDHVHDDYYPPEPLPLFIPLTESVMPYYRKWFITARAGSADLMQWDGTEWRDILLAEFLAKWGHIPEAVAICTEFPRWVADNYGEMIPW